MVQKKYSRLAVYFLYFTFLTLIGINASATEQTPLSPRSVELTSSNEFIFTQQQTATFTIRPLKPQLRTIENLENTEAVGVVYLGDIELTKNATPLSALRDVSLQISKGLGLDLALITDSTTSKSLAPHELLLLYHPELIITLALTRIAEQEPAQEDEVADTQAETEQTTNSSTENSAEQTETDHSLERGQYSLIGTYAIPPKLLQDLIPPSDGNIE